MVDKILSFLLANPVLMVVLIIVILAFFIVAFRQGREITTPLGKIGPKPERPSEKGEIKIDPNDKEVYENSNDERFANKFKELFFKSRRIVLIGTGFYILQYNDMLRDELPLVSTDHDVEIYAANPFSPNVETRLIEEETGSLDPNIGKSGLKRWLRSLLKKKALNPNAKFSLQLFPFYPTYAFFIFFLSDDNRHYFSYPYGYAQLGTRSPVLHYWSQNPDHEPMVKFLDDQYKLIKERSVDGELVFNLYPFNKDKVNKDALTAFAVYLIPAADSCLYKFGSEILEYDVRAGKELKENTELLHNAIGAAFDYGLHVTIADALYCATQSDINLVCKEVEFLANEFRPFSFKVSLEKDFPNEQGIALVCHDKTGSLEALHHEMVARVYRKASASNYNFDPALANRDKDEERAKLMIKYYHAPYILQRFKPHFSLLSNVASEQKEQVFAEVRRRYVESIRDPSIEIGKIAIMHRPDPKGHWQILHEYPLGGVS